MKNDVTITFAAFPNFAILIDIVVDDSAAMNVATLCMSIYYYIATNQPCNTCNIFLYIERELNESLFTFTYDTYDLHMTKMAKGHQYYNLYLVVVVFRLHHPEILLVLSTLLKNYIGHTRRLFIHLLM